MDIDEISVYVKTYTSYTHLGKTTFMGLRDISFMDMLWRDDLLENPFKDIDEYSYKIVKNAYDYEPLYEKRELEGYYKKNWQSQGMIANLKEFDKKHSTDRNHKLKNNISNEQKSFLLPIVLRNLSNFKGNPDNKQSIHYKLNNQSVLRPSLQNLKNVEKGRYLDIFKRNKEGKVLLRSEYYFDGSDWCEVSVKNLSSNRKVNCSAKNKYIKLPASQTCYLMISDVKQAPQRLEALRKKIEKRKIVDWNEIGNNSLEKLISRNLRAPELKKETVIKSSEYYDDRLRVIEIPPLKNGLNEDVLKRYIGYEDIVFENNQTIPTVIVPDYVEYAEFLFEELDKHYSTYLKRIGTKMNDTNSENSNNLLKYLTELVCDQNNKWDTILESSKHNYNKILKNDLFNTRLEFTLVNYYTKKLSWWISQSAYQDLLYDYEYYYNYVKKDVNKFDEAIFNRFGKYLEVLESITVANDALLYLYNNARCNAYLLFKNLNYSLSLEDFNNYLIEKNKSVRDDFALLQSYENIDNVNWLIEIFYPRIEKPISLYLNTLATLTHIVVISEGKNYRIDELFSLYRKFCRNLTKSDFSLTKTSLTKDSMGLKLSNKAFQIEVFYLKDDIETSIISNFGKSKFNRSLRRAICVFNKVIALYKLSKAKDGNDYIVLFSSIIGDILELTKFDNRSKDTFLHEIKINGNQIIKKYSDLVSIATSVFTFCYYLYEGDTEYAILDFSCDMLFLLLATAFTGILFFFLKMGCNYLINQCKTDDYEKWAMCNNYGKLHESLMNENIWKHRIYKNYVEDFSYTDIKKHTPKWYASALEQIKTYYKLGINLKVEFCPFTYNMLDNICEENYEAFNLLKIDITTNMFYKDDFFKIDFEIKRVKKDFSFILKNNDLNVYYDNKKGGYKIVIILVNDISMISNYLLEELMMEYSSYAIKPKKIHFVEAREFLSECSKGVFRFDSYVKHRFGYHSSYYNDMGESPLLCKEGIDYVPMRYFNYEY